MVIILTLARELGESAQHVEYVVRLLDQGNTIPFIARYRKELHGSMDDTALRTLEDRLNYLRNLDQRRQEVKNAIDGQGKLTDELSAAIDTAATLAEVEALDALEPYGAGNARPVFCLRGATLDRLQNVGQNRHLKLRLTKGSAQFDGIFFSAVAQTCGVAPGDRVDAAFYLQINEFRSSRTVQMQMVDIRPSLTGSTREEESLELVDRCLRGDELRPRDAVRLLPSRDQCVSLWRALQHAVPPDGLETDYLPLLRRLSGALQGAEPFLRTVLCLEVFRERGLLQCCRLGDSISLHLTSQGKKVALDRSEYLLRLHQALDASKGGAR